MAGPSGHDICWVQSFPITCIIGHATNWHKDLCFSILDALDQLWINYALVLITEGQKDREYLCAAYCTSVGWLIEFM